MSLVAQEWYCQDCWRISKNPEVLSYPIDLPTPNSPPWSRLLKVPGQWLEKNGQESQFPWRDFEIRELDESLRPIIESLYKEVFTNIPMRPNQSCLEFFFTSLAASKVFQMLWAGENRGPFVLPAPFVKDLLTLDDVLHGLGAPSLRKPCESALTLTDGVDFRCPISLPRIQSLSELLEVLRYGTIFLNTASLHWRAAAELCLAANRAFQFPSNINVYVTGHGRRVSTDVHTDNHDVLILHSEGAKHWRVFAPPARKAQCHPLYRGKNEDKLLESELGKPLLDLVLHPGEILFVPMGFPHATGTAGVGEAGVSVHLTLGLSTADYDLCLGGLRKSFCNEMGVTAREQIPEELWWQLLLPLPVGFLVPERLRENTDKYVQEIAKQLLDVTADEFSERKRSVAELSECAKQLVTKHLTHHVAVLDSQEEAYQEVISSSDGIFYLSGPEQTRSEYRRAMLLHQIAEDERKRCIADVSDPRFVRRIDPLDGVARTFAELQCLHRDLSTKEMATYWGQCQSLYPKDQPPEELIGELQRASETCKGLLYFLQKRTPHLQKSFMHESTGPLAGHKLIGPNTCACFGSVT